MPEHLIMHFLMKLTTGQDINKVSILEVIFKGERIRKCTVEAFIKCKNGNYFVKVHQLEINGYKCLKKLQQKNRIYNFGIYCAATDLFI